MKTYNISRGMTLAARLVVLNAISEHDYLTKSYFFKPALSASDRRNAEKRVNARHPSFKLILSDDKCCAVYVSYTQTSRNVYYSMHVVIEEKGVMLESKDVRFLKKLIATC